MKLDIMSDLHFEMRDWQKWLRKHLPEGETLVLAGDICYLRDDKAPKILARFCERYQKVFYVPGNHEYYTSSIEDCQIVLKKCTDQLQNLTVLQPNERVEWMGRHFLGGTMWYRDDPMNFGFKTALNDFKQIGGYEPWIYEQNAWFRESLASTMQPGDVVVTHHLPTHQSVPVTFRGNNLNRFYVCDMSTLIEERQPKLWIHGHTHVHCDYQVVDTRVYANPLGYPGDEDYNTWNQYLTITV